MFDVAKKHRSFVTLHNIGKTYENRDLLVLQVGKTFIL
jgi:hypothetical protein